MKRQRIVAAVLIAAVTLSGCTSMSLEADLLTPPKATGTLAAIQSMIEKDADGSYTMLSPLSGEFQNGIIRHDIDSNDTEEAIALYVTSDKQPRLLVAEDKDGYQLVGSTAMYSDKLREISFADIDADGREELLICYDDPDSGSALEVFHIGNGVTVSKAAKGFGDFITGDFDGDSSIDILTLDPPRKQNTQAHLMIYTDGAFSEKSACGIDSDVTAYINLSYGNLSEDLSGAVVEGQLLDGTYTTQLLYYDAAAHLLVNPMLQNSGYAQSKRTAAVTAMDIDDDDIIEIPVCAPMDHLKTEEPDTICNLVHWCEYEPELMDLSSKQTAILCEKLGFALNLSAERLASATGRYTGDDTVTLYRVTYDKAGEPVIGKEQLTIHRHSKNEFDSTLTAEANLYEGSQYVYTYILGENSPFNHDEIESGFKLLEADQI